MLITGRDWWRGARVRGHAHAHGGVGAAADGGEAARGGCLLCADDPGDKAG